MSDSKARTYVYAMTRGHSNIVDQVRVITPSDQGVVKYDLSFTPEKAECSCMGNREHGHCKHVRRFKEMANALIHGGPFPAVLNGSSCKFKTVPVTI